MSEDRQVFNYIQMARVRSLGKRVASYIRRRAEAGDADAQELWHEMQSINRDAFARKHAESGDVEAQALCVKATGGV